LFLKEKYNCKDDVTVYNSATQMADRGPNPDLWMVTGGPRQPLKGLFYTHKCYHKILRFWPYF